MVYHCEGGGVEGRGGRGGEGGRGGRGVYSKFQTYEEIPNEAGPTHPCATPPLNHPAVVVERE